MSYLFFFFFFLRSRFPAGCYVAIHYFLVMATVFQYHKFVAVCSNIHRWLFTLNGAKTTFRCSLCRNKVNDAELKSPWSECSCFCNKKDWDIKLKAIPSLFQSKINMLWGSSLTAQHKIILMKNNKFNLYLFYVWKSRCRTIQKNWPKQPHSTILKQPTNHNWDLQSHLKMWHFLQVYKCWEKGYAQCTFVEYLNEKWEGQPKEGMKGRSWGGRT